LKVKMKKEDLTTSTADAPVKTDVGPSAEKSVEVQTSRV